MGEIMMKGTYGRSPKENVYKEKNKKSESDIEA
jgi:hypothetical protein